MPLRLRERWMPAQRAVATPVPAPSPIFLPQNAALVDQKGFVTRPWWPWFQQIVDAIVDLMTHGATQTAVNFNYRFSTDIVPPPGTQYLEMNGFPYSMVTAIYASTETDGGTDVKTLLLLISVGAKLYVQQSNDSTRYATFVLNAEPIDHTSYVEFPVTWHSSGSDPITNNQTVSMLVVSGAGADNVTGPATAVANNVVTFDGTTGKVIKDSGIGISKVVTNNEALTYGGHLTVTVGGGISIQSSALRVGAEGSLIYPDNIRQYFNPGATTPGLNVGGHGGDPTIPVNGDVWYNDSTQKFRARQNGVTVDLISAAGGGGDVTGPASATDNNVALFNGATGKVIKDSGVLMTNIAIRNQSNTFTTVTATSNVDAALWMQTPQVVMIDNSQPANARRFDLRNTSQFFVVQVSNDGGGALFNALGADRNGDCYVYRNLYEKSRSAPMGHWVDEPFNAANFSVDAGTISGVSLTRNKYFRIGNTLTWQMSGSATLSGGNLLCRVPTVLSNYTMSMQLAYVNSSGQIWTGRVGIWDNTWVVVAITGASVWSGASNWSFSVVLETF